MNVDMMLEWAAALESGQYKQGHGRLHYLDEETRQLDRHCCIGVACLIFGNRVGIHRTGTMWRWDKDGVTGHSFPIPLHKELFPGSYLLQIPEAIQLKHNMANVTIGDPAYLNDTWEFSFEDIAACIRYTVEKYQEDNRG